MACPTWLSNCQIRFELHEWLPLQDAGYASTRVQLRGTLLLAQQAIIAGQQQLLVDSAFYDWSTSLAEGSMIELDQLTKLCVILAVLSTMTTYGEEKTKQRCSVGLVCKHAHQQTKPLGLPQQIS